MLLKHPGGRRFIGGRLCCVGLLSLIGTLDSAPVKGETMTYREPLLVVHLSGVKATEIVAEATDAGDDLPSTLVIPPGVYRFRGRSFDLRDDGLYRFMLPPKETQQRIVRRQDGDPLAFISAACWMHSHGYREDGMKHEELLARALTGKLIMTCGPYSDFCHRLFNEHGLQTRKVAPRALYRNGFDDGHIALEVMLDDHWTFIDVDQHVAVRRDGRRLSFLQTVLRVPADDYELEPLALSVPLAVGDFVDKGDGYDYAMWMEAGIHSEATLRRWYRHILAVPLMGDGHYTMPTEAGREMVERHWAEKGLKFLPMAAFAQRYYAAPPQR